MLKTNKIIQGNCLDILKTFPNESINCCVTSPPYWGLRDYGTAEWVGGDNNCKHVRMSKKSDKTITGHKNFDEMLGVGDAIQKDVCNYCGAKRVDEQLGLEKTPEEYVDNIVKVFKEIKRVLKNDGTLWLNLGDSYIGGNFRYGTDDLGNSKQGTNKGSRIIAENFKKPNIPYGHKQKDLTGIPWMVAFALKNDGWYLRQDIIWHKPNPMPESVTDRCTKSHEYIFLLSKSAKYYFNNESIKEKTLTKDNSDRDRDSSKLNNTPGRTRMTGLKTNNYDLRNKRSVWTVATKPFTSAHFATFPEDLILPCILAGCPSGGIVLDPFMGAGTTVLVAKKNGCNYVGCELNEDYIKIAEKRLSQEYLF